MYCVVQIDLNTLHFIPVAHKLKKPQLLYSTWLKEFENQNPWKFDFTSLGKILFFTGYLSYSNVLILYDKKLPPFVNLSTVYEKTKWAPVSINWGNSASFLLVTNAFINFQLTAGPYIIIWINLDMLKPEIPSSKFLIDLHESHDQRTLNPNTKLELYSLWNPNTLLTNPFHIP